MDTHIHSMAHWLMTDGNLLAVLITAGVAVLVFSCLTCSKCGARDKDEIFRQRSI